MSQLDFEWESSPVQDVEELWEKGAEETEGAVEESNHCVNADPVVEFHREAARIDEQIESERPSQLAGPLFFDIETIPDFSREGLFNLPELPEPIPETPDDQIVSPEEFLSQSIKEMQDMVASKNPSEEWILEVQKREGMKGKPRKGVLAIVDQLRTQKSGADRESAIASRNKIMATTPEMCRIVAIGFVLADEEVIGAVVDEPTDEAEMMLLEQFWLAVQDLRGPVVGYNIIGFDLPVILARSILLGVPVTKRLELKKFGNRTAVDLMLARFPNGNWKGLNEMVRLYGVGSKTEGMDGSKVLETLEENPELVRQYVKDDVELTRGLYRKWQGYFV